MTDVSLGARLRRERERRQIALSSIAANTKISVALFEGLERDDVSRWPSGIFRRAFIRAYAEAIGLDAGAVTREFLDLFPDPTKEPAGAGGGLAISTPWHPPEDTEVTEETGLRLILADDRTSSLQEPLWNALSRCAAVVLDVAIVCALGLSLFLVLGAFWMPLAVSALCYFGGAVLVLGKTPGVGLVDLSVHGRVGHKGRAGQGRSAGARNESSGSVLELGHLQRAFGQFPVPREERLDGL